MNWYIFFSQIINMSFTGSIVIVVVLAARLLWKRAPKVISYGLWAVVLVRLLCPLAIPSELSFLSFWDAPVKEAAVGNRLEYISIKREPRGNMGVTDQGMIPESGYASGTEGNAKADFGRNSMENVRISNENTASNSNKGEISEEFLSSVEVEAGSFLTAEQMIPAAGLWGLGGVLMVLYEGMAYYRLRRRLRGAVHMQDNIFRSDYIASPFVLGVLRPRIYLPSALGEQEQSYILLHEQCHIRRLDHVTRVLAFLALVIHWFNPLVWLAFVLSGRDMEMSCDEAVVKRLGEGIRADYSASLLGLATGRRIIAGMPLAFGEGDPAGRIRNLARWRKPAMHVVIVAAAFCGMLAVVLLTNPREKGQKQGSAGGGLACKVESAERSIIIDADYFPGSFDFNYDEVISCRASGDGKLTFKADWAPKELIVDEDYYEYWGHVARDTYYLQPNSSGEYELPISHRNPEEEEQAYYFIGGETGKHVLKIQFSAEENIKNGQINGENDSEIRCKGISAIGNATRAYADRYGYPVLYFYHGINQPIPVTINMEKNSVE